jgi:hypothetical protein
MFLERSFCSLSLAIQLFDCSAIDPRPSGKIEVSLKNSKRKAIRNPRGHFVYLELENGNYKVCVESDYYLKKEFIVPIPLMLSPPESEIDFGNDVHLKGVKGAVFASVDLMPDVNYPFPSGATLVRGEVVKVIKQENSPPKTIPVPEAIVHVSDLQFSPPEETELEFQSNQKGQFILYVNKLTKKVIKEINGKKFNGQKFDNKRWLMLQSSHSDFGESRREVCVEDGKTTTVKLKYKL